MCALFTHGQGWELRLVVDGDLARSTVCGSQDEGLATAEDWERQLRERYESLSPHWFDYCLRSPRSWT